MPDADSSAPTDIPAPDFEVPRLEVLFDSFGDFLEQAAADLAAAEFEIRSKEDLDTGELAQLEIGLRGRSVLVRALGRVVETPEDEGNGNAATRLSLTWLDPASEGLVASIRRWYPPVAEPGPRTSGDSPDAFASAEWDVDLDALDEEGPDLPLPAVEDEVEIDFEEDVEIVVEPELPEPQADLQDALDRLDAEHPERSNAADPGTVTDPFAFDEDNLYDSGLRPPEEIETGSFPLKQEPWRAPLPSALAEQELRPSEGDAAVRAPALAFGEGVAFKTASTKRSRWWLGILVLLVAAALAAGAWWYLA